MSDLRVLPTPYYDRDGITLYCGDCREIVPHVQADVMLTDPPYGIAYETNWNRSNSERPRSIVGDESTSARDDVLSAMRGIPALVFGSWKSPRPLETKLVLVWEKAGSAGMGDLSLPWRPNTEEIYVLGPGWKRTSARESSVIRFNALCGDQLHPNEKPTALIYELMRKCPPGVVLDPFAGSGTTLLVARDMGRKAIGIEIEEKYCALIVKRLAQGVLFT